MTSAPTASAIDPAYVCDRCGRPLTEDDFSEVGLRLPDFGEARTDYYDDQLLDELVHVVCPTPGD